MNEKVETLIYQFTTIPWFAHVGEPIEGNVFQVKSWQEANKACSEDGWEIIHLRVNNMLASRVNQANYDRFKERNPTVKAINERLDKIIQQYVQPVATQFNLGKPFLNSVSWDIMMCCIEEEFSDVTPPVFFLDRILPIYQKGHFACGWRGPFIQSGYDGPMPDARIVVY
jgi:hypothetical protein